jgi:hypothetical protein
MSSSFGTFLIVVRPHQMTLLIEYHFDFDLLISSFQIGHVLDSPVDFYSDRIAKKDRKKTLVDELLADAEFKKFSKRKYVEIIDEKSKYQRNKRFKHSGKGKKSTKATAK